MCRLLLFDSFDFGAVNEIMSEGKPFESNCLAIASCALDAANPTKRKILLNDVISSVQNEASSRKLLTSKFGAHVGKIYNF